VKPAGIKKSYYPQQNLPEGRETRKTFKYFFALVRILPLKEISLWANKKSKGRYNLCFLK